jgi:hypothetical protein
VFNNIRSFVQKEVNNVINNHLTNKNYNVNDAQIWTNQICDDVGMNPSRSSRTSRLSTKISNSLPTASSCRRQIADSTYRDPASGTMRSMARLPSSGMQPLSYASLTSSGAHFDTHHICTLQYQQITLTIYHHLHKYCLSYPPPNT